MMKALAIEYLTRLLRWLAGPPPPLPDLAVVRLLMAAQDAIDARSGEAKRHQVLAALIKRGMTEADAAFAIERVVQERNGVRWIRG